MRFILRPIRIFSENKNQISLAFSEILWYRHTSYYFYLRIYNRFTKIYDFPLTKGHGHILNCEKSCIHPDTRDNASQEKIFSELDKRKYLIIHRDLKTWYNKRTLIYPKIIDNKR